MIKLLLVPFFLLATWSPLCNFLGEFLGRATRMSSSHFLIFSSRLTCCLDFDSVISLKPLNFPVHRILFSCNMLSPRHCVVVGTPSSFRLVPYSSPTASWLWLFSLLSSTSVTIPFSSLCWFFIICLPFQCWYFLLQIVFSFLLILHICSP